MGWHAILAVKLARDPSCRRTSHFAYGEARGSQMISKAVHVSRDRRGAVTRRGSIPRGDADPTISSARKTAQFLFNCWTMNDVFRCPILLLVLSALVAGCATSTEQLAQRNNERCAARGLQPNTDAFAECATRLETERDVRIQSRHRDLLEKTSSPPYR